MISGWGGGDRSLLEAKFGEDPQQELKKIQLIMAAGSVLLGTIFILR